MITDEIRAKLTARTAVVWCAHADATDPYVDQSQCCRFAVRTAVYWPSVRGMLRELRELIEQRATGLRQRGVAVYMPSRGLPELYVWPTPRVIAEDPGAWSEIVAIGESVGVHLIEG